MSDTTNVSCDNWAHGTNEIIGHEMKSVVTCVSRSCSDRCLGSN